MTKTRPTTARSTRGGHAILLASIAACWLWPAGAFGEGTWSATSRLARHRSGHTATLLLSGRVLVAGGFDGATYLSSTELYDPATGMWTPSGSLATARAAHTATLLPSGNVLVVGGSAGSS